MQHNADVIICTGPSKYIPMFVYGVNHNEIIRIKNDLNGKTILSAASCTTNCVAPILKMINDKYTIESGAFNTVHAVTASQNCVDKVAKNFRTGRCCFNIIPSTTGAADAVEKILPELAGKLHGAAMRVPVPNVSVSDIVLNVRHEIESLDEIYEEIESNKNKYHNVLSISKDLCVSSDYIGSPYSCIVDYNASCLINKNFVKLVCWYDNEHAYSCRVVDLIEYMENKM